MRLDPLDGHTGSAPVQRLHNQDNKILVLPLDVMVHCMCNSMNGVARVSADHNVERKVSLIALSNCMQNAVEFPSVVAEWRWDERIESLKSKLHEEMSVVSPYSISCFAICKILRAICEYLQ